MNPEWLSAHLDGELSDRESAELGAALADDPALRAELDAIGRVRATLRSAAVEPPAGSLERIVATLGGEPDHAPVIPLASRRRVPTFAAVAAAVVIIASVVGGVGGTTSVPALGELVARHEAAAAESEDFMAETIEMPMDKAATMAPTLPADFEMQHAFVDGPTVHLVYQTPQGVAMSVFRQQGSTDMADLPAGEVSHAGSNPMWSATYGTSYVAVVDSSGFVWVVVAAEPHDTMMVAMMDDLPSRSPSFGDRARDAADAAIRPFRFWD